MCDHSVESKSLKKHEKGYQRAIDNLNKVSPHVHDDVSKSHDEAFYAKYRQRLRELKARIAAEKNQAEIDKRPFHASSLRLAISEP